MSRRFLEEKMIQKLITHFSLDFLSHVEKKNPFHVSLCLFDKLAKGCLCRPCNWQGYYPQ